MQPITLKHQTGEYRIISGAGVLTQVGAVAASVVKGRNCCVVTDSNVAPLYGEQVCRSLEKSGFQTCLAVIPAGEESKCLAMLERLYSEFNSGGITRGDVIVALGGGVVGDLAGFAAATYLRGVGVIQVPTTLLAQVDSSIGGKTGIDLSMGKNLAGAFHQPKAVIADSEVLATLPKREFASGMAEVIKYGCIRDKALFDELLDEGTLRPEHIRACEQIKCRVVQEDEFETGDVRVLLNFGHTVGHGIEKVSDYQFTHGRAVAIGMVLACKVGQHLGLTPASVSEQVEACVIKYGLPHSTDYDISAIMEAVASDKKKSGKKIRFVYLKEIGQADTIHLEMTELEEALRSVWK